MRLIMSAAAILLLAQAAWCGITIPSADGSDGAFAPTANVEIDLSKAVTGVWNQAGNGNGVYDGSKWAVVFKYSSVNIPSGITVTFKNHPSYAPVVWLVSGDVTIDGTVDVSGKNGPRDNGVVTEPGPGGFRGGAGRVVGDASMLGLGIGAATSWSTGDYGPGGSYGTVGGYGGAPTYGNVMLLPLIGGSGGASRSSLPESGGAGGGAILIASTTSITMGGSVLATGGSAGYCGGGSGGGIRLVCESFAGGTSARLRAIGGSADHYGGCGRIRIETNSNSFSGTILPDPSITTPGDTATIWPPDTAPSIKIVLIGGVAAPDDSRASLLTPNQDVKLTAGQATQFTVQLQGSNVPTDWKVQVRLSPRYGSAAVLADATFVSGDASSSVWQATVTVPTGISAMQAHAYKP